MLQVRMEEHCVEEAFLLPARLHQSWKAYLSTNRHEAPPCTGGLQSILSFLLLPHKPQAHALLWASICKSHLLISASGYCQEAVRARAAFRFTFINRSQDPWSQLPSSPLLLACALNCVPKWPCH